MIAPWSPRVLWRQHDRSEYIETRSILAGIDDGLTRSCAECGADLTRPDLDPIAPAALLVFPSANADEPTTAYALALCLDCTPAIVARVAASLNRQEQTA